MASFCLWTAVLVAFLFTTQAVSQSIVDDSLCENRGFRCPRESGSSTSKYCCLSSDGGRGIFECCNPYLGLYIGVGLGVPVIVMIVVAVVMTYCCCVRYQNRKMSVLLRAYNTRREEEMGRQMPGFAAPPPYDPTANQNQTHDVELPSYTEQDPYTLQSRGDGKEKEEGVATETAEGESASEEAAVLLAEEAPKDEETETLRCRQDSSESQSLETAPLIEED